VEKYFIRLGLVTPLASRGFAVSQSQSRVRSEFRWPAIRGQLRHWYRAIDPEFRLHEARIFGRAADADSGQGVFLLRPDPTPLAEETSKILGPPYFTWPMKLSGSRSFLRAGQTIGFYLLFKRDTDPADQRRVLSACWTWLLVGGMGFRSRRGLGTLVPVEWPDLSGIGAGQLRSWGNARGPEDWMAIVETGLNAIQDWLPGGVKARVALLDGSRDWWGALGSVAAAMQDFRRSRIEDWRRRHREGTASVAPEVVRFGLPVRLDQTMLSAQAYERSASAIWIRVAQLGGRYYPYIIWWPAPFLPDGQSIRIQSGGGREELLPVPSDHVLNEYWKTVVSKAKIDRTWGHWDD
jgi:CRISPR-associated protein Cmr1